MARTRHTAALLVLAACATLAAGSEVDRVQVLSSTAGLPAHIAGMFQQPLGFAQSADGTSFVFDSRAHAVYRIEAGGSTAQKIVEIGSEEGRILEPSAFDLEPLGSFVVADGPNGRERVQIFNARGDRLGGFTLPGRNAARIAIGSLVLNGVGSLDYTGQAILISQPETGSLITEYTLSGRASRTIGRLSPTGHEADRDLHLALNVGIPLAIPGGGFYYVFMAGVPRFQRYSKDARLLFERHIEGPELDPLLVTRPTTWPRRTVEPGGELPLVLPLIRTAAVDPEGHLWIALTMPYAYEYDASGDKVRTVQFRGAGPLAATSLYFPSPGRLLVTPGCYEFRTR